MNQMWGPRIQLHVSPLADIVIKTKSSSGSSSPAILTMKICN